MTWNAPALTCTVPTLCLSLHSPTEIPKRTPSLKARHSAAARSSYRGARRCFACFCTSRRGIWPLSPQSGPQVTTSSYSTTDHGAQSDRFRAPSGGQSVSSRVQSFSCPLAVVKRPLKWRKKKCRSVSIYFKHSTPSLFCLLLRPSQQNTARTTSIYNRNRSRLLKCSVKSTNHKSTQFTSILRQLLGIVRVLTNVY